MSDTSDGGSPHENDPYRQQAPGTPPAPGAQQPPYDQPGQQQPYGQPGQQQPYGQPGYPPPGQPYGAAGYPPPGSPYGAADQPVQIGEAFNYGWNRFTQNAGAIIGGVLAWAAALLVLSLIFFFVLIGTASTSIDPVTNELSTSGGFAFGFTTFLFIAIVVVLSLFVQAVVVNVSLLITRGKKIEFADFFRVPNLLNVILAALLIGLGVGILSITVVGGIVLAFFAQFTLFYVIDKNLGVLDAIKASFSVVSQNLGTVVVLFLGVYVAQVIGTLLCYVGLLVALPVAQIATAYVYRRLNHELPA
ncbi:hypothetical protein [Cellulosimicrobium sp. NPDC057127]|uniref:DUF7544 domain-containing protein n=1 Tax=Cellulosimicrobium sp. NPDC057127 TaxID=3346026 RepID=UPI003640AAFF